MKFFDLTAANEEVRGALDDSYRRVLTSGWTILGPELEAFEQEFASYCESSHCVGVANGLDALVLALRARGISQGDEVIVPSHTFVATWLAVAQLGAIPVPAEVDGNTFTIDPSAVAAAVTPRTAAIIAVSLYGHPVHVDPLRAVAERHGLFLLEDAAQAHGARYRGRRVGSLAHATAFSFYPTKNLGALGDAGAVVTGDAVLADRMRTLRNYGSREKYVHVEAGVNSRLDELQAAFLRARLPLLDDWNDRRRALAAIYHQEIGEFRVVTAPTVASWAEHVYHLYVILSPRRDQIASALKTRGITTLIHYPVACHLQEAFRGLGHGEGAFPIAERLAREVLSLPMWPQMAAEAARGVSTAIGASVSEAGAA